MQDNKISENPRVIVIQKLYSHYLNKDSVLTFPNIDIKNLYGMLLLEQLKEKN